MTVELSQRVKRLERRLKAVTVLWLLTMGAVVLVGATARQDQPDRLRVREITVVDEKGTERIWIGAPVPDPIIQGERKKRSGPVSGVILLDAKGNERAGYVTSDRSGEVFVGLDSEQAQEVLFLVNPGGGGHLSFFDKDHRNLARIGVLNQRPGLLLREKGEVVFEEPKPKSAGATPKPAE